MIHERLFTSHRSFTQLDQQTDLFKRIHNDYARALCRSDHADLSAFVLKETSLTLLDVLWLAIAYGRVNRRPEAIDSKSILLFTCFFIWSNSFETNDRRYNDDESGSVHSVNILRNVST